jgi:hypothetical protein
MDKTNLSPFKRSSTEVYNSSYKCHSLRNLRQLVVGYVQFEMNLDAVGTVR